MKTGICPISRRKLLLTFTLLASALSAVAQSSVPRQEFWVPNGPVNVLLETNGIVYLGGHFSQVHPYTGSAVLLDATTGQFDPAFPRVDGVVNAAESDGSGGWFLGGLFTKVGPLSRKNLAHLKADRSVDEAWNPGASQAVYSLARSGGLLYVGGEFSSIAGAPRKAIAALDTTSGAATGWNPDASGGAITGVYALAPSGTVIYAGGSFTDIGGAGRNNLAALDTTSGLATGWNPSANGAVLALVTAGDTIYAAGNFNHIGVQPRGFVGAINATSGKPTSWNPSADNAVLGLALVGNVAYVGGAFHAIGGQPHERLAAIDLGTGLATSWSADADGDVATVSANGNAVYAGGQFTRIGNQPRAYLASVDTGTGQVSTWNPNVSGNVLAVATSGGGVLAGGNFKGAGGMARSNLCSLVTATGVPTPWSPDPDGEVTTMAGAGNLIYAGGRFANIGGRPRAGLAALDASGQATSWNPNAIGDGAAAVIHALQVSPSAVFVTGTFTNIGGQPRLRAASVDPQTGLAGAWNPSPDGEVRTMIFNGEVIYAGGSFTNIGGQPRNRLAALDPDTGLARDWSGGVNSNILCLALVTNRLYAGGTFDRVGTTTRRFLTALNPTNGTLLSWTPNVFGGFSPDTPGVFSLAIASSNNLCLGGNFMSIGNAQRRHLALLSTNAQATAWNPAPNTNVLAVWVSGDTIFAGGAFTAIGGESRPYFAVFSPLQIVIKPVILPSSLQFSATGRFQFQVRSGDGDHVIVQASTNFVDWVNVETNVLPSGQTDFLFVDPRVPDAWGQFYRAVK